MMEHGAGDNCASDRAVGTVAFVQHLTQFLPQKETGGSGTREKYVSLAGFYLHWRRDEGKTYDMM
jgi:hypothetical protein